MFRTMFRLRRHRLLLICAFVLTVLLYHVSRNSSQWDQEIRTERAEAQPRPNPKPPPPPPPSKAEPGFQAGSRPPHESSAPVDNDSDDGAVPLEEPTIRIPQLKTDDGIQGGYSLPNRPPLSPRPPSAAGAIPSVPDRKPPSNHDTYQNEDQNGSARFQEDSVPASAAVHWQKPSEWFPVPEESLIMLPTGKPKPIPSVQFAFKRESPAAKEKRERRLAKVKAEAERAWSGYKTHAWTHDELMPVSNRSKDPFCGWAATLVDALDTLWIMGLVDEFDNAVKAVGEIDFTTTPYRDDIPVFETIIRYLGGLIGAYDVTGDHRGRYRVLLDKAVELAEILMGVFDTPNRLPILYYDWRPQNNVYPKRASVSAGVAELGSMSMEFTRLAQLTGKNKYYDAIARITDAFEGLQNRENATAIPGIFPEHLDASGCNRTAPRPSTLENSSSKVAQKQASDDSDPLHESRGYEPGSKPSEKATGLEPAPSQGERAEMGAGSASTATPRGTQKRDAPNTAPETFNVNVLPADWDWDCVPQDLVGSGYGSYSMGGSQDSAYEYFPKQYILLGGLEAKYRAMHEKVADAVKEYLLFRPMAEGDPDILFSAKAYSADGTDQKLSYEWDVTHLTCFLGGMFGLGGKIFNRPEDVEVGKKLADGCVWAYDIMPTGIMPEAATVYPCKKPDDCRWNQTAWYQRLDPGVEYRETQMEDYSTKMAEWKQQVEELKQEHALRKQAEERKRRDEEERKVTEQEERKKRPLKNTLPGGDTVVSHRSLADLKQEDTLSPPGLQKGDPSNGLGHGAGQDATTKTDIHESGKIQSSGSPDSNSAYQHNVPSHQEQKPLGELELPPEPLKPQTHEEYVTQRIQAEHIPPGFVHLHDKQYLLRPEAIESVWYMYRITGDASWQEKGWRMFEAIIRATQTEAGHSAIRDVASLEDPDKEDSMESFWLAETLKYFYLLFATPDVISLDEWVLNTEAHPFRRPT